MNAISQLLKTYTPKTTWTTGEEVNTIINHLDLESKSVIELQATRAVTLKTMRRLSSVADDAEKDRLWNSAMSIVAVIDHVKVKNFGIEYV